MPRGRYEYALVTMRDLYNSNPSQAIRGQSFIKTLHHEIAEELHERLSDKAIAEGIRVVEEARIFGSFKSKDVDVAVIHPLSGPLLTVGVRSQMTSVAKNALTYYQDIIGECISLQERYPMMVCGYVYLHPLLTTKGEAPNHERYAKMYAAIGLRDNRSYKTQLGSYDQFSYMVVDFDSSQPVIRDDIVQAATPQIDMSIHSFVNRMVDTFKTRNVWLDYIFD